MALGDCGWLWVVVGGFGSFLVLVCTFLSQEIPFSFVTLEWNISWSAIPTSDTPDLSTLSRLAAIRY